MTAVTNPRKVAPDSVAAQLIEQARAEGVSLVGPGSPLAALTKQVLESALEVELDEHLGYEHGDRAGKADSEGRNERNGTRGKTVHTELGPVTLEVPRDRDGTFEPVVVRKRQRRLNGVDEMVLSLSAKGLTTGEIADHFAQVYGQSMSKDTISRITDKVIAEMVEWQNRPLDPVYPVVFIDAIHVKVRDGQVTNKAFYVAIGVTTNGERDILGIWAGNGGEGAKHWLAVLTELKNRGVADVLMLVCDGLKGLPEAVNTVWDKTVVQTCVIHLLRNTFKYAARQNWDAIVRDIKPVYTAPTAAAAEARFAEFADTWGSKYPAAIGLWRSAWEEFIPFLAYDVEIRRVICTTNAIESLNARFRRAVRARGHFPTDQAALKCLYLVARSLDPTGTAKKRWMNRWKPALNAFAITFPGRLDPAGNNQ
ncbi:IS256 family transposase [Propioniciclava sp. MC1683]|jgi:putative transposase|nr:IS256 family transposase [Propioniciclava sp. MC1683]MBB1502521.1 IS256 family transposase [Propioniciclava sp. MC1683]